MPTGSNILWVDDLDDDAVAVAGSKIARLGALRRIGITVPDGFVVTTTAYSSFLAGEGLIERIDERLARITDSADLDQVEAASLEIRRRIELARIPEAVAHDIAAAYDELCFRHSDVNVPVAVRSSATGEDGAQASCAGQYDTYLGVSASDRVLDAVRRCWASLFSTRALAYRLGAGLDYRSSPMAVGVIELVHARCSGVAFSVHPVTGKSDRIVIEGSFGWGEAVVQGLVNPDHLEIDKSDGRILCYHVGHKEVVSAFDYAAGLVVETDMPERLRDTPIVDAEQMSLITEAVIAIESRYGYPVDVEWVISRHRRQGEPVTIVQTRPITVHGGGPQPALEWDPVQYASKYAFNTAK